MGRMSAEEMIAALGLEYLEGEGCWIRLLWRTEYANAIYALLTPQDFSAMHRLVEDEAWTFIAGDPAQMLVLNDDGTSDTIHLGVNLSAGEVPHFRIPAGAWQGSVTLGDWTLVSCVLAPAFSGFELADENVDWSRWPNARDLIDARMRINR